MARAPGEMHPPARHLDEEQHVQASEPDRIDREEIDGDQASGVSAEEAPHNGPESRPGGPEMRRAKRDVGDGQEHDASQDVPKSPLFYARRIKHPTEVHSIASGPRMFFLSVMAHHLLTCCVS